MGQVFIRLEYQIPSSILKTDLQTLLIGHKITVTTAYAFSFQCEFHRSHNSYSIKIILQVKGNNKKRLKASDFNLGDDTVLQLPCALSALNAPSCFLSNISMFHGFI